jgi:hypothetical protein
MKRALRSLDSPLLLAPDLSSSPWAAAFEQLEPRGVTNVMNRFSLAIPFLVAATALAGCNAHERDDAEARGRVGVSVGGLTQRYEITSVIIESEGATATLAFDNAKQKFVGSILLPPGTRTVTAKAYARSQQVGVGTGTVTIEANKTSALQLRIIDTTGALEQPDAGPFIVSLASSADSAIVGVPLTLRVNAVDANGDVLNYGWTSTCGGDFGSQNSAVTTWSPTVAGPCKLTANVTSNAMRGLNSLTDTESIDLIVFEASNAAGAAAIEAQFIPHPTVDAIQLGYFCEVYPSTPDAMCPRAIPTSSVRLSVLYADYGAGNLVVSDDCGGTFHALGNGQYDYDLGTGVCTIKATLTSDGLSSSLALSYYRP